MSTPTRTTNETRSFYRLLQQALTVGIKRVSPTRLPQFIGAVIYFAYAGAIASAVMLRLSTVAIVTGLSLLIIVPLIIFIFLWDNRINPAVLNGLAVLIVVTLMANLTFATIAVASTVFVPKANTLRIWGFVQNTRKEGIRDVIVKLAGRNLQTKSVDFGEFGFDVPRDWIAENKVLLLLDYKGYQQNESINILALPVTITLNYDQPSATPTPKPSPAVTPTPTPRPTPTPSATPKPTPAVTPTPTAQSGPSFPWPPPQASASVVIRTELLGTDFKAVTLADIDRALGRLLDNAGYFDRSYYLVPDGFAAVTHLEQIDPDGSPRPPPDRWTVKVQPLETFTLIAYLRALLTAKAGLYRIIVFVVTPHAFSQAGAVITEEAARSWLAYGSNKLPPQLGKEPFTNAYTITALIYEFRQSASGSARLALPSDLPGRVHLEKANLLQAFQPTPTPTPKQTSILNVCIPRAEDRETQKFLEESHACLRDSLRKVLTGYRIEFASANCAVTVQQCSGRECETGSRSLSIQFVSHIPELQSFPWSVPKENIGGEIRVIDIKEQVSEFCDHVVLFNKRF